jgi:hypothetical protein
MKEKKMSSKDAPQFESHDRSSFLVQLIPAIDGEWQNNSCHYVLTWIPRCVEPTLLFVNADS